MNLERWTKKSKLYLYDTEELFQVFRRDDMHKYNLGRFKFMVG